jgi:hypothetical protein
MKPSQVVSAIPTSPCPGTTFLILFILLSIKVLMSNDASFDLKKRFIICGILEGCDKVMAICLIHCYICILMNMIYIVFRQSIEIFKIKTERIL